jgi:CheY-like chemotaxis protein
MRPEVLERVFEPFFTTKNPGDGTGLGLASVYGVIKQSEGVIRVASKPGEGTTFSIYLKRTTAPSRPTVAAVASPPVILLVEDEALVRSSTTHLLRSAGYEVVEAEGAEKALGVLADDGAIDLVITDVRMPGMDGEELARKIHASRGHVPILFISSFADAGQTVTGDVEFIRKPFASDKFVQRVRRLLPLPPPR